MRIPRCLVPLAGTLFGWIIQPSIILIILGDVFQEPVGDLFRAALWPGLTLVAFYIAYIVIVTLMRKDLAPPIRLDELSGSKIYQVWQALKAIVPPLVLITLVLGSILTGVATPTESSSVGGVGAIVLATLYGRFSVRMIWESSLETVKITAMVFAILIGATAFSMVFTYTGGDWIVEQFMLGLPGEKWGFLILSMLVITALGFFIDFVEISYIVVPILAPIAAGLDINPVWYAILVAMNLQTSFLTPPFGFSLFYLKGVAPPGVRTTDIYYGVVPFIVLQLIVLGVLIVVPQWFGFSAH